MRIQSLLRKLVPASIVALVLAFSYFAPALGLVAPRVSTGVGVNCGRFGYGYHGGKHLFICPNSPQPAPAIQPLAAPPPPLQPKPGAPAAPILPPAQPPAAVAPPVVHHVVALTPAPQNVGPVKQTGALARLAADAAESPFVVIALILVAVGGLGAAIALRLRRRRQP